MLFISIYSRYKPLNYIFSIFQLSVKWFISVILYVTDVSEKKFQKS